MWSSRGLMRTTGPIDNLSYSELFFSSLILLTIFLVHLLNFPKVHPSTKDVVIELISMGYSGQLETWESAERMEIKTIEACQDKIKTTEAKDYEEQHLDIGFGLKTLPALMRSLTAIAVYPCHRTATGLFM